MNPIEIYAEACKAISISLSAQIEAGCKVLAIEDPPRKLHEDAVEFVKASYSASGPADPKPNHSFLSKYNSLEALERAISEAAEFSRFRAITSLTFLRPGAQSGEECGYFGVIASDVRDHPAYVVGTDGHGYIYGVRVTE